MQYVLMIHAAESRFASRTPAQNEENTQAYVKCTRELIASGKGGDWAALEPTATATCVQLRNGKRIVKDGPFAETREQLGGYYTAFADSEEEALSWAAKIPDAQGGTIEVRPIVPYESRPVTPKNEGKEYLLLIYDTESTWASMTPAEQEAAFARYSQFGIDLQQAGKFVAGEQLDAVSKAKSLRMDGTKRVVRDGPFAETREQLGGYYRLFARDLDEAIALACKIPAVETGTIEIRPVMDTSAHV